MSEQGKEEQGGNDPIIIDLGKQKKKRVKRLRKGRGRLMSDISLAMQELAEEGVVKEGAQPVLVIVREKRKQRRWPV